MIQNVAAAYQVFSFDNIPSSTLINCAVSIFYGHQSNTLSFLQYIFDKENIVFLTPNLLAYQQLYSSEIINCKLDMLSV